MAAEVFIDTSGFYAQWDRNDPAHERAKTWLKANRGKFIAVTTEWVIGETCTLLMA
jgi:predicted nucleic acid-binding protein